MTHVPYDQINEFLKKELEEAVASDLDGLSPETLYNNISFSTGNNFTLSNLFGVSFTLVTQIKMLNKPDIKGAIK